MIELETLHEGTVAVLTLKRPPANAFTPEGLLQLQGTVERLNADARVRAIVVTGDGPKFFSAGADLNTFADGDRDVAREAAARFGAAFEALQNARPVVIAVDAGHGGDDPGARGKGGTLEKMVTLEIARNLAKLIDAQPGMQAVLTRSGDYFVPLEKRFAIAREHKADLFVSIHANSCPDFCDARGASVWVLSTHGKQSEAGKWLAKSENASPSSGISASP